MSSPCWRELEHVMLRLHTTIWSPCRRIWLCWGMNVECLRSMMDHNSVPSFLIREVKHWIPVDWFVEGTPLPFMMRRRWDFSYLLSTSDVVLRLCTMLMLRLWWLIRWWNCISWENEWSRFQYSWCCTDTWELFKRIANAIILENDTPTSMTQWRMIMMMMMMMPSSDRMYSGRSFKIWELCMSQI